MTDRRDDDDEGLSSEDLLKEAKSQFGLDDGSSGVADSLLETSVSTDLPSDTPSIDEIAAELARGGTSSGGATSERDVTRSSSDLIGGTREPDAIMEDAAARDVRQEPSDSFRVVVPDPGIPTGLPSEPVEVDSDEVLAGLPAPPEVTAKAGGLIATLWRNRWIVVVAVVGISVLAGILDDSAPIADRAAGDCFNNPDREEVSEIDLIDCSDSHELEVFATVPLTGNEFPGDFGVAEQAFEACIEEFEGYVGEPYATSALYAFPFSPTEGSWNDGDREALCVVYEPVPGTNGEEIMSRTGSVRGSGL